MSEAHFDDVIHAPLRLRICAMLAGVDMAGFAMLKESLDISDSVLSKHLSTLETAGYVKLNKFPLASKIRTSASLTPAGRTAFAAHLAALRDIAALADPST